MKKIIVLFLLSCLPVLAMEQKSLRKERYGRCLSSATGKDLWHPGYSFSIHTHYNIHLKSCMETYRHGVFFECFSFKQGKAIESYADCANYCEDNLVLYGQDSHKICLRQCALVYTLNDQLKK